MIIGIGVDIVSMSRMEKVLANDAFIDRIYTEREVAFAFEKARFLEIYAGTFAAKEAVSKALGTGVREFSFEDIEILRDELGAPYVVFHGKAEEITKKMGIAKAHLSISHERESCVAICVLEK